MDTERRRGTCARLLGHYFLHGSHTEAFAIGGFMLHRDSPTAGEEREARVFAMELLMPRPVIKGRLPYRPTAPQVVSLAEWCGVSPLTMAMRLQSLGYTVPASV